MCLPMPLRLRGPTPPPPKPPPTRRARAKPALEPSAHSMILETAIRSPVTPSLPGAPPRCARPCRFVGGGPDGPLRNLPQHGWRGQSPRSKPARTPRSSRRRFAPLSRPLSPVDHYHVLAHAASAEGAHTAPPQTSPNPAGAGKARARTQRALHDPRDGDSLPCHSLPPRRSTTLCSPMPLRRRGPRRPPPKPPPTRLARAKPALETSAHSKILETTIRSPVTPTLARRSLPCACPCRFG